jgi:hypothetical protein
MSFAVIVAIVWGIAAMIFVAFINGAGTKGEEA